MSGRMQTSIFVGGAVVVACFGLTLLEKRETNSLEPDALQSQDRERDFPEEVNRANLLVNQKKLVDRRIEFSRRIARELIAQRVTLWEAAAQLQNLDHHLAPLCREYYESVFPTMYPGRSERERYCRRAMALVNSELVLDPAKRAAVIRSLDQEFRFKFSGGAAQAPYREVWIGELH